MNRLEQVRWNHQHGYNCAQAVACAYCEQLDIEESILYRLTEGFGKGHAVRGTCGALSGAIFVLSALNSDGQVGKANTKLSTYDLVEHYIHDFSLQHESYVCKELLAIRAKKESELRTCTDVCVVAAELLEKYIKQVNS